MRWPVLLIGIVLVAGVVIFALSYGTPSSENISSSTPEIISGTVSVAYQNSELGFSVMYPLSAQTESAGFDGQLSATSRPIAGFKLPSDIYRDTNLVEAGLYIGVSSDVSSVNRCSSPSS